MKSVHDRIPDSIDDNQVTTHIDSELVHCPIPDCEFHYWGVPGAMGFQTPSFGESALRKFDSPCDHYVEKWTSYTDASLEEVIRSGDTSENRIYCVTNISPDDAPEEQLRTGVVWVFTTTSPETKLTDY